MLQIYKSSAGSGKTYTLVKEYLRLALRQRHAFKHILAITFTNKAAAEMKLRVFEALNGLALGHVKYKALGVELMELLQYDEHTLKSKANDVHTEMLHHYADISIGTIDSFVHRVVRAFAHDLRISKSFEVEMDSDKLLQDAVAMLLDQLSENEKQLTDAVIEFAESKIEDGKGWHIEHEIIRLGSELFKEDAMPYLNILGKIDFTLLQESKNNLRKVVAEFRAALKSEGENAMQVFLRNGISAKEVYRGNTGIYGFFKEYASGNFPKNVTGNSWVLETIQEDKWGKGQWSDTAKEELRNSYRKILHLWNADGQRYNLYQLLLKNFHAFMLLADLEKLLQKLKKDKNLLHISDFQQKVFEIVKKQEAPVIYERLGEWYDNILIDEFQDTSLLQFRNLLPLIENTQFKSEDSLLVGDAKQAIYRFRGGQVEQFAQLPDVYGSHSDDILKLRETAIKNYGTEVKVLNKNYRSRPEVVMFNNRLYDALKQLPELENKAIFEQHSQECGVVSTGGYVQISFLDPDKQAGVTLQQVRCEHTLLAIQKAKQHGYAWRDIAVLCRSNKNASAIATFLLQQSIPVVSSESLLLFQSPKVKLLLSVLRYIVAPDNLVARVDLVHFSHLHLDRKFDYADFTKHLTDNEFENSLSVSLGVQFTASKYVASSLIDNLLLIADSFCLSTNDPFVQFFCDEVIGFSQRFGQSIATFLDWWEQVKYSKSIVCPENTDAVRIMTIHKSKGLQFPVVILADANGKVKTQKDFFWTSLTANNGVELPVALLPCSSQLAETEYAGLLVGEQQHSFLDTLNLLYVATTRAEDALFIFSEKLVHKPTNANSVIAMLSHFLDVEGKFNDFDTVEYGDLPTLKNAALEEQSGTNIIDETASGKRILSQLNVRFNLSNVWSAKTKAKIEDGLLLHTLLKEVRYAGDEERVVRQYLIEENPAVVEELIHRIKAVTTHAQLASYFETNWRVLNERAILTKVGAKVPDRVLIDGNSAVVIDYKTGAALPEHRQQVNEYAMLLNAAGFDVQKKIILYTNTMEAQEVQ
ncbi:MAG: UvrD-helicase domain-containing protein [Chitinophagales bacterium]|nr:UvrD-helicase domain-containing protein [Chitinophagales bacterium]